LRISIPMAVGQYRIHCTTCRAYTLLQLLCTRDVVQHGIGVPQLTFMQIGWVLWLTHLDGAIPGRGDNIFVIKVNHVNGCPMSDQHAAQINVGGRLHIPHCYRTILQKQKFTDNLHLAPITTFKKRRTAFPMDWAHGRPVLRDSDDQTLGLGSITQLTQFIGPSHKVNICT